MRLSRVEESLPDLKPAAREILARCNRLLVKVLEENRRIAHNLRPTELDNLGLAAACGSFCNEIQLRTNLKFESRLISPSLRLPPMIELNLFRIVQEALNNMARHSQVKEAWVRLSFQLQGLALEVEDHGSGLTLPPKNRGIGLVAMRERAQLLGGEIDFTRPAQGGTLVRLTVPKERPDSNA